MLYQLSKLDRQVWSEVSTTKQKISLYENYVFHHVLNTPGAAHGLRFNLKVLFIEGSSLFLSPFQRVLQQHNL